MGSIAMAVFGIAAVIGAGMLLQQLRPRENRPSPAWAQTELMSTLMSLTIVVGLVFGLGMIIAGFIG